MHQTNSIPRTGKLLVDKVDSLGKRIYYSNLRSYLQVARKSRHETRLCNNLTWIDILDQLIMFFDPTDRLTNWRTIDIRVYMDRIVTNLDLHREIIKIPKKDTRFQTKKDMWRGGIHTRIRTVKWWFFIMRPIQRRDSKLKNTRNIITRNTTLELKVRTIYIIK